jgi:uncharacterized protein YoxC
VVWWIVAAIVAVALVVLALAAGALLSRLRELRGLERALNQRAAQAAALQEPVAGLQRQAEAMQEQLGQLQEHLAARAATRGE